MYIMSSVQSIWSPFASEPCCIAAPSSPSPSVPTYMRVVVRIDLRQRESVMFRIIDAELSALNSQSTQSLVRVTESKLTYGPKLSGFQAKLLQSENLGILIQEQ